MELTITIKIIYFEYRYFQMRIIFNYHFKTPYLCLKTLVLTFGVYVTFQNILRIKSCLKENT